MVLTLKKAKILNSTMAANWLIYRANGYNLVYGFEQQLQKRIAAPHHPRKKIALGASHIRALLMQM
jgi:hypothetical protein